MAVEIVMPALEMAQETGTLVRWLKKEGERVGKGELLMEIETDKALVEIEATDSGILSNITAQPGDEVPVGQVIALLLSEQEQVGGPSRLPSSTEVPAEDQKKPLSEATVTQPRKEGGQSGSVQPIVAPKLAPASPKARRLARERGIDLSAISGSGPQGSRSTDDVLRTAAEVPGTSKPGSADYEVVRITGMRKTIAERLHRSHQAAPHISLTVSVVMSQVRQRVKELKAKAESPVGTPGTVTAILSKAVAAALIQHPRVNSHLIEQEIREYHVVHLGMAVALEDGLVVPVIRNVESKSVAAIQSELEDLIPRARSRRLHAEEMKDGTFTISNLGMFGIEQFSAILNPPEVGILSVGAIRDIPVGVEGKVVLSPMMQVTVNVDHRAVDGAVAARFLNFLKEILENPDSSLV